MVTNCTNYVPIIDEVVTEFITANHYIITKKSMPAGPQSIADRLQTESGLIVALILTLSVRSTKSANSQRSVCDCFQSSRSS